MHLTSLAPESTLEHYTSHPGVAKHFYKSKTDWEPNLSITGYGQLSDTIEFLNVQVLQNRMLYSM